MRISDWSSDVCSSDLLATHRWLLQSKRADDAGHHAVHQLPSMYVVGGASTTHVALDSFVLEQMAKVDATLSTISADRKSVVSGKSVSVREDLGVRCII